MLHLCTLRLSTNRDLFTDGDFCLHYYMVKVFGVMGIIILR